MRLVWGIGLCLVLGSCVSNESTFSDQVKVDPVVSKVESAGEHVLGQNQHTLPGGTIVEWFSCFQGGDRPSFVILSVPEQAFTKSDVCTGPVAAELLEHGFNVIAVNRPGQGASTGRDNFGDDASLKALVETMEALSKEGRVLRGLWAYGEASVLAFRLAKAYAFTILVIGDGIYDWEQTVRENQDQAFRRQLAEAQGSADSSFAETRSIAWDFRGLPRRIYLYHNNQNQRVKAAQASAFKQSLAAGEYRVDLLLYDSPPPGTPFHPAYHRGLLTRILSSVQEEGRSS